MQGCRKSPKPESATVLVADDEKASREVMARILADEGYQVAEFDPATSNAELLTKPYDVAVIDVVMPRMDGFEVRRQIASHSTATQFIFVTGLADKEKLEKAMDLGAFGFLVKPFSAEQLCYATYGALRMQQLFQRNLEYDGLLQSEEMGLVGNSLTMREARRKILEVAPLEIPVLITGESGTGKDIVSRCIHRYSNRSSNSFVAINCASLTPTLVESELFGHVQGAFTGATRTKHGFFEVAHGGTLFLDEIGDLPMDLQTKFLRVLDRGEFSRVGETSVRQTSVRIVSATNRDLGDLVRSDRFRQDLYYRLRGASIGLSPLRERKEDIPLLVRFFLEDDKVVVPPQAMDILLSHNWPGNVRELAMVVASLKGMAPNRMVTPEATATVLGIPQQKRKGRSQGIVPYRKFRQEVLEAHERAYFKSLMDYTNGNVSKAAKLAGMHRPNFYDKLKKLNALK